MGNGKNTETMYAVFGEWYEQRQQCQFSNHDDGKAPAAAPQSGPLCLLPGRAEEFAVSAKRAYEQRRVRDKVFQEPDLFGEPVWDMLLDIAASEQRGSLLSITSACVGSCVAETTALRWLKVMEVRQLVCREADPRDGRRSFIRLTKAGRQKLKLYFAEIERDI